MSTSKNITAKIARILPFSTVDGPGNRMVFFLQGCNYSCPTCHNPETINLCNHCGDCVITCPTKALTTETATTRKNEIQTQVIWNKNICIDCNQCLDTCPTSSQPKIHILSVDDVLNKIKHQKAFIRGITFSGGEATLQRDFIKEVFKKIKTTKELSHLTCLIDSNGSLRENAWEDLFPWLDGTMIDLKAWLPHTHKKLTGRDNLNVKKSLLLLAKVGKLHEIRLLVIPNKTDYLDNIEDLSDFLLILQDIQNKNSTNNELLVRINGFNHYGVVGEARSWEKASKEMLENLATQLRNAGIKKVILPPVII